MKHSIKIALFSGLPILVFFIIEYKQPDVFGIQNSVIFFAFYNLLFAGGLLIYGFFQRPIHKLLSHRLIAIIGCLIFAGSGILASVGDSDAVYLTSLVIVTLITGIWGGIAYYSICAGVQKWWRGRVIAAGICGATLVQYGVDTARLLLEGSVFFILYVVVLGMVTICILWLILDRSILQIENRFKDSIAPARLVSFVPFLILLSASAIIICYLSSLYEGIIIQSQPENEPDFFLTFILNNTRLLYGASIVVAGIIADLKGRQYLPMVLVAIMTLQIINIYLLDYPTIEFINWMIIFTGAGFLAMYITLSFVDFAHFSGRPAFWASGGRIIKHIVTAFGSVMGAYVWSNFGPHTPIILSTYLVLLAALIFLLFKMYEYLKNRTIGDVESISFDHDTSVIETQKERFTQSRVERIIEDYKFTQREKQILTFILTGIQIKEIARELFISERTVKFHISNILIKAGVKNQKELMALLSNSK